MDTEEEPSGSEDFLESPSADCMFSTEEICKALNQHAPHSLEPLDQMSASTYCDDGNTKDIFSCSTEVQNNQHEEKPQGDTGSIIVITVDQEGFEVGRRVYGENDKKPVYLETPDLVCVADSPKKSCDEAQNCDEVGDDEVPVDVHSGSSLNLPNNSANEDVQKCDESCDNEVPIELHSDSSFNPENLCDDAATSEVTPREKKKRQSIPNKMEWAKNQTKTERMRGDAYVGYRRKTRKNPNIILRDVIREGRTIGPPCTSTLCAKWKTRLCNTISEEERKEIFDEFWKKMDWSQKRMFVCSSVDVGATAQKTTKNPISRRASTPQYHLKIKNGEKVPVCRELFLSTLGLKRAMVRSWLQTFHGTGVLRAPAVEQPDEISDGEETDDEDENNNEMGNDAVETIKNDTNRQNDEIQRNQPSTSEVSSGARDSQPCTSQEPDRKGFLRQFFQRLPKLKSHYCRKNSNKMYLQTDITNWTQLYELYSSECVENLRKPLSRHTFDRTRKECNVALHKPKKDRCDLCYNFENKISSGTSEEYQQHRLKKEQAQMEKEKDKAAAKKGDCHTLCCDLMAVQTVPRIRASSAYFRLKLTIHNFTVYDLNTHEATNFWFDETESSLSASTFASFLVEFLTKLLAESPKTVVIIYSDGCGYQNRNAVLSNALLHLSVEKGVTIVQKYLVKGHTYMECDSVHSTVEHAFKNVDIYLPNHYALLSKTARKNPMPYRSTLVDHTFFKDFGREESMAYQSIRPGKRAGDPTVNDIRMLQYDPNGKILYKLDFSDELKELPYRPKPITRSISSFPALFETRPVIPKDKFNDLQWLKKMLPTDTHSFYDSIPCEEESRRQKKAKLATAKNKKSEEGEPKQKVQKKKRSQ